MCSFGTNIKNPKIQADKKYKILVGIVSNILKPGKANQISVSDNKWITLENREVCECIKRLYDNIVAFMDIKIEDIS